MGTQPLVERNEDLDYGAEIGALGEALAAADVPRAAIANADGAGYLQAGRHRGGGRTGRRAGVIPDGAVGPQLLEAAPDGSLRRAPVRRCRGGRVRGDLVAAAASCSWRDPTWRAADRHGRRAPGRGPGAPDALRWTDDLVAELLAEVDPARDSVLVVGPYHRRGPAHLTVAGPAAPDIEPGLLRSGTTRRTGIVTLVDIAPTILDLAGVERPSSMEGRRFERSAGGPSTGEARAEYLAEIDAAARYRDRMVAPVALTFVVLQAVLWVLAPSPSAGATAGSHGGRLLRPRDARLPPATYLARLIDFHTGARWAYWAFLASRWRRDRAPRRGHGRGAARTRCSSAWASCSACSSSTCSSVRRSS